MYYVFNKRTGKLITKTTDELSLNSWHPSKYEVVRY